jgi:hypothetical protein
MTTNIQQFNEEVSRELANKDTFNMLVATTFKGLNETNMKLAIVEGMTRGFTFKDFLEKNIYAIPYGDGYSLVTSIDYARKVGMRSGVVGKSEPTYEVDVNGKIISCAVTIKKSVGNIVGDFSARVYFSEYTTHENLWTKKPRTMIAKVAEMHALRMACPEELSHLYTVEELEQNKVESKSKNIIVSSPDEEAKLRSCKTMVELSMVWSALPLVLKKKFESLKNEIKIELDKDSKMECKHPDHIICENCKPTEIKK